jgi:hypothetical protein
MLTKLFFDVVSDGPKAIVKAAATSAIPGSDVVELAGVARDLWHMDSSVATSPVGPGPSSTQNSPAGEQGRHAEIRQFVAEQTSPGPARTASRGLMVTPAQRLSVRR